MSRVLTFADRAMPVLVVLAASVGVLYTAVGMPYFTYDEGVYFHQAAEWARGRTPYTDYFVPQPPGILGVGVLSQKAGLGIGGVRAVSVACGLLVLVQTYYLGRRVSEPVGWASAGLVASTAEWTYTTLEAATQAPTTVLVLLALHLLWTGRGGWAGLVIAAATLFRIQAVTLLPGLGLAELVRVGWRAGLTGNAKLAIAVVVAAAVHGFLSACVPGYWDGVFGFQFDRPRMPWAERGEVLAETFSQPAALLGLLAAVVVTIRGGPMRPLGVLALVSTLATAVAGNSLFRPYFLVVLPPLAVCLAAGVNDLLTRFRDPPVGWAGLAVLTVACGFGAIRLHAEIDRREQGMPAFLDEIRQSPADVWLTTDGRLMELTGKRMVTDYFATDPGGLFVRDPAAFQAWFRERLTRTETVAVTDLLLQMLTAETARELLASGKPLVFETPGGRQRLSELAERAPRE